MLPFRGKRRPEKIHQKSPAFFNAKSPGKPEQKKSTKVFWGAGKVREGSAKGCEFSLVSLGEVPEGFGVGFRWVVGMVFLWKMRAKGEGGGEGGGGGGVEWGQQVNAHALSKLPLRPRAPKGSQIVSTKKTVCRPLADCFSNLPFDSYGCQRRQETHFRLFRVFGPKGPGALVWGQWPYKPSTHSMEAAIMHCFTSSH